MEGVGVTTEFWRGRRVLLTGHTGFKGAWLSLWLQALGAELTGFALAAEERSLFRLARVAQGMESIEGDVRELAEVERAVASAAPEIVIHMAAQAVVRAGYEDPVGTYATNIMGTVHVLEAVRRTPSIRTAVIVTSDKCYENREWLWAYRESDPMGGRDPYSSSKGCTELVTSAYRDSFFADTSAASIVSGRAGNVIGGGDWTRDRLIPDVITALMEHRPVKIRRPDAVRPWQHVLEPLRGYLMLAERSFRDGAACRGAWNFGPAETDTETVQHVVNRLVELWPGGDWDLESSSGPHEATLLRLDAGKARWTLGWSPRLDLSKALQWTVDWYREFASGGDVRSFSEKQISAYESLS